MSRVGIISEVHETNKIVNLVGYGEYLGDVILEDDLGLGIDITVPEVMLDTGHKVTTQDCYWAEETVIKDEIANYEAKGYEIKVIVI